MSKQATSKANNTKRFQVLVPYDYEHEGAMKTGWTRVGAAFPSSDGEGFNIELRPGICINGRVVVRPVKPREDGQVGDDDLI